MSPTPTTADFGSRFSAFMIDLALLFSLQWLVVIVASRQLQAAGLSTRQPCAEGAATLCDGPSTFVWVLILMFLVSSTVAYHAVFDGQYGATPGKRMVGLEVVSQAGSRPIGLMNGTLRSIVRQAFWLVLFFVFDASPLDLGVPAGLFVVLIGLAVAMMAVSAFLPDGLALHDRVAQTRVVRSNRIASVPVVPYRASGTPPGGAAPARRIGQDLPDLDVEESV